MKALNYILAILIFQLGFGTAYAQSNVSKEAQQTIDSLENVVAGLQNTIDQHMYVKDTTNDQKLKVINSKLDTMTKRADQISNAGLAETAIMLGILANVVKNATVSKGCYIIGIAFFLIAIASQISLGATDPEDKKVTTNSSQIMAYAPLVRGQLIERNPALIQPVQALTKVLSTETSKITNGEINTFDELEDHLNKDLDTYFSKYNPKLTETERQQASDVIYASLLKMMKVNLQAQNK